jgi:hypothetical protein
MKWLARLKKLEATPTAFPQNLQNEGSVGSVGLHPAAIQNSKNKTVGVEINYPSPANAGNVENRQAGTLQNLQKPPIAGYVGAKLQSFQNPSTDDRILGEPDSDSGSNAAAFNDRFLTRLALFAERGLSMDDAEQQAQRLARRGLERDDRRLCLECQHLSGSVEARRCSQWQKTGAINGPAIPAELPLLLQRCAGFRWKLG